MYFYYTLHIITLRRQKFSPFLINYIFTLYLTSALSGHPNSMIEEDAKMFTPRWYAYETRYRETITWKTMYVCISLEVTKKEKDVFRSKRERQIVYEENLWITIERKWNVLSFFFLFEDCNRSKNLQINFFSFSFSFFSFFFSFYR